MDESSFKLTLCMFIEQTRGDVGNLIKALSYDVASGSDITPRKKYLEVTCISCISLLYTFIFCLTRDL